MKPYEERRLRNVGVPHWVISQASRQNCPDCDYEIRVIKGERSWIVQVQHDDTCPIYAAYVRDTEKVGV
jgi:hypothetical protein